MAITGSGTQADPYIVDTWTDFVSVFNENNKYITFPADTVFDFNEIQDYANKLTGRTNTIDGNGVCFENVTLSSGTFLSATNKNTFSNIDFKNLYFSGDSNFISSSNNNSWVRFVNCKFSGIFQGTSHFNYSGDNTYFGVDINSVGCGFNLKFMEQAKFKASAYSLYFYNCQIILDYGTSQTEQAWRIANSLVLGRIKNGTWNFNATNSIINAEITTDLTNSNASSVSVINFDKIGEGGTYSGFTAVTTVQLKDESYLQSINFPIGV